jgi:hypothetical protein
MTMPDTRAFTLVDLPLLRRLSDGTVLDCEVGLTRDARGPSTALLSSIVFPRGWYTLVTRADDQQVVGQFRYKSEDLTAHIVYLASNVAAKNQRSDSAWLHILDAMTHEAGRHGAHSLVAEVDSDSPLFETMRHARFASYTRQTIWRHDPVTLKDNDARIVMRAEEPTDQLEITALMYSTVPTMLQQVTQPTSEMHGLVYRTQERMEAYIAYTEGNNGVYLIPYIHPDAMENAANIIISAVAQMGRSSKVPVYVCVRSYQCWLDNVMVDLNFEAWAEQAIMVKHIAASCRHPGFSKPSLQGVLDLAQRAAPVTYSLVLVPNHHENEDATHNLWNDV